MASQAPLRLSHLPLKTIIASRAAIHAAAIRQSPNLKSGQFGAFSGHDLRLIFDLYDQHFFSKQLRGLLEGSLVSFAISTRMTSAGASIRKILARVPDGPPAYRITVSATVLFASFDADRAGLEVNGVVCRDRLSALQLLIEHEIVHLCELLVWGVSSHGSRFREIAQGVFGHTDFRHRLITSRQRADRRFGIHVGDLVAFAYDGHRLTGRISRITKRATVCVPGSGLGSVGGRGFHKFYVPLPALVKLGAPTQG